MSRLLLPQIEAPRTAHLNLFEREYEGLNAFYWVFRASAAFTAKESVSHDRLSDFIPSPEAGHLNITAQAFRDLISSTALTARYGILVQVITLFEVYLSGMMFDVIKSKWPYRGKITIKIRPSDLPPADVENYLKSLIINSEVDSIIGDTYNKRTKRINNLLTDCGYPKPDESASRELLVIQACEFRNCIVHTGGKTDDRAVEALSSLIPSLSIGDQIPLDEALLWQLTSAVRDNARAVDYALRKQNSDKRILRRAKRKRKLLKKAEMKRAKTMLHNPAALLRARTR